MNGIETKINRLISLWEDWHPSIVSISIFIALYVSKVQFCEKYIENILNTSTTVASVFLGFIGTATVVMTSFSSWIIKAIKKNDYYWRKIIKFFKNSMWSSFLWIVISWLLNIVCNIENPNYYITEIIKSYRAEILISIGICSSLCFLRTVRLFFILLEREREN